MAGRKRRRQPQRSSKRTPKRRRRGPRGPTQLGKLIGKLAVSGVRSVLGVLPGSAITTPVADFIFKQLGVSFAQPSGSKDRFVFDAVYPQMLHGQFSLTPANIYFASRGAVLDLTQPNVDAVYSVFREARVLEVSVQVIPTNPEAQRNGELVIGLNPRFSIDTPAAAPTTADLPDFMTSQYMSVRGLANRPLTLKYRPRVSDGRVFTYMAMTDVFTDVAVVYNQPSRSSTSSFTADEFSAQVLVRGKIEMRYGAGDGYPISFNAVIPDNLSKVGMFVKCVKDGKDYTFDRDVAVTENIDASGKPSGVKVVGKASLRNRAIQMHGHTIGSEAGGSELSRYRHEVTSDCDMTNDSN